MVWKVVDDRRPATVMGVNNVAGGVGAQISAGVVTGDQLYSQQPAPTKWSMSLQSPATWATIWVVLSVLYLVGIYVGSIRISGGE